MIDNTDEKDIELMFAEARRYDLLTAEQEQEIDAEKADQLYYLYCMQSGYGLLFLLGIQTEVPGRRYHCKHHWCQSHQHIG